MIETLPIDLTPVMACPYCLAPAGRQCSVKRTDRTVWTRTHRPRIVWVEVDTEGLARFATRVES